MGIIISHSKDPYKPTSKVVRVFFSCLTFMLMNIYIYIYVCILMHIFTLREAQRPPFASLSVDLFLLGNLVLGRTYQSSFYMSGGSFQGTYFSKEACFR